MKFVRNLHLKLFHRWNGRRGWQVVTVAAAAAIASSDIEVRLAHCTAVHVLHIQGENYGNSHRTAFYAF